MGVSPAVFKFQKKVTISYRQQTVIYLFFPKFHMQVYLPVLYKYEFFPQLLEAYRYGFSLSYRHHDQIVSSQPCPRLWCQLCWLFWEDKAPIMQLWYPPSRRPSICSHVRKTPRYTLRCDTLAPLEHFLYCSCTLESCDPNQPLLQSCCLAEQLYPLCRVAQFLFHS